MKRILLSLMILTAISARAEDTPFSVVTRCEGKEIVLTVERRVVDIYSAKARFEDRILRGGDVVGTAKRSVSGSVIRYTAESGSLKLTQNYGSMQLTSPSGAYTIRGTAAWIAGEEKQESLSCITYDHL